MEIINLNQKFSTTCGFTQELRKIENHPSSKVKNLLFLPPNPERQGQGGLRTKGYFKRNQHDTNLKKSSKTNPNKDFSNFPLVTIITVVFNGTKYLEQTIKSVINQTYDNIEYIIIDGGSIDGTLDIIRNYEKVIDYWVSEPDKGIYNAMNKGIKLSQGMLIGLINSDDWYGENAVETVVEAYLNNSKSNVIITGAIYRTDSQGNILFKLNKPASFLDQKINRIMPVNHPATFVNREVYAEIGLFDEQYKIAGDYDFIYRAYYSKKVDFLFTEACLAYMRLDGLSEKPTTALLRAKENFLVRSNQISLIRNIYIFLHLFLWDLSKKIIQKLFGGTPVSIYRQWRYK
ncbi:MAG: glycosyltransferase family 2 protein [Xenococcaceae cyanobacterium MO_188.B29]|nr:glycosyltransferase family 2 protein [Xenococcaceae cyanobacterium MO_188.B29]